MSEIAVSIICLTYNQEKYIRDALDGFLKQQTDFAYEILIHDDVSTDGTVAILKEYQEKYPDRIRLILEEENQYSKGIDITKDIVLPYAKGRYTAICEGDDYWIYEKKLQKQYELMEANPNVSLCYHNALVYNEELDKLTLNIQNHPSGYISDKDVIYASKGWYPTSSIFCRTKELREQPNFKAATGDVALRTYMACRGKLYFMNKAWSIYRDFAGGSWNEKYRNSKRIAAQYIVDTVKYFTEFERYSKRRFTEHIHFAYMAAVRRFFRIYYAKGYTVSQFENGLQELKEESQHEVDHIIDQFHDEYIIRSTDYYEDTVKYKIAPWNTNSRKLYLYGAGAEAVKAIIVLVEYGIRIDGCIVSKKRENEYTLLNYPIYSRKEINFQGEVYVWPCLIDGRNDVLNILREEKSCCIIM